jgi:hypothetical protein
LTLVTAAEYGSRFGPSLRPKGEDGMSRRTLRLSFVLLCALAALGALLASAAVGGGNPTASGHGNLTVGDGQTRTFSFTATQRRDGTVTGQSQVNNPSFPIRVHFAIDCLKFDRGNRVIASGPVTHSSDPGTIAVGRISVFAVEDNGEGANAAPDRITTIPDYAPPKSCNDFSVSNSGLRDDTSAIVVRPWRAIEAGQIQVRP